MKKQIFLFYLCAILFCACGKDKSSDDLVISSIKSDIVTSTTAVTNLSSNTEVQAIYLHNGSVIQFNDLNLDDDNIEVYAGFTVNQNELLVFFNDNEVNRWLKKLPDTIRLSIEKERLFKKQARFIAVETNAIAYFEETGKVSNSYQLKIDSLRKRIWLQNSDDSRGGIGFIYASPNFSGQTYPLLGLGLGYPLLFSLDKNLNSAMTVSVSAQHSFHTKRFFFGTNLIVNGWFQYASVNGGPPVACGGAAGPFTVQLVGVLSSWGSFGPKGNLVRSYTNFL